jgi:hypothetical protein
MVSCFYYCSFKDHGMPLKQLKTIKAAPLVVNTPRSLDSIEINTPGSLDSLVVSTLGIRICDSVVMNTP